jgi:hypothetical protein
MWVKVRNLNIKKRSLDKKYFKTFHSGTRGCHLNLVKTTGCAGNLLLRLSYFLTNIPTCQF